MIVSDAEILMEIAHQLRRIANALEKLTPPDQGRSEPSLPTTADPAPSKTWHWADLEYLRQKGIK